MPHTGTTLGTEDSGCHLVPVLHQFQIFPASISFRGPSSRMNSFFFQRFSCNSSRFRWPGLQRFLPTNLVDERTARSKNYGWLLCQEHKPGRFCRILHASSWIRIAVVADEPGQIVSFPVSASLTKRVSEEPFCSTLLKPYHSSSILSDPFCPAEKALTVPLLVDLPVRRHVIFCHASLIVEAMKT